MKICAPLPLHEARGLLDRLNQNESVEEKIYKEELRTYQLQFLALQRKLATGKGTLMVIFEGPDAAGKGGAIKRLVEKLDPRTIRVYSIVKPTAEEYRHHYLWRFWSKIPAEGEMAIFDRSWYGRVLVERVEGFAAKEDWRRAYDEINAFEETLFHSGCVIVKLYLHITKEEQLERFKKREADPAKAWKINEEDWRNREHWDEHNMAAEDMFARTSTRHAPWHLVAANFKWHTRVRVLKTLCSRLEKVV
jgi:polyphosphate kinase 2 (PPK2 family)